MSQVIPFPNDDEIVETTGKRRFFVYDTRPYVIEAQDEEEAFDIFYEMSEADLRALEVDGGNIEVISADLP